MIRKSITQDTRYQLKKLPKGNFPLKLQLYPINGKQEYCALNLSVSKKQYQQLLTGKKLPQDLMEVREKLDEHLRVADRLMKQLNPFSWQEFERQFFSYIESGDTGEIEAPTTVANLAPVVSLPPMAMAEVSSDNKKECLAPVIVLAPPLMNEIAWEKIKELEKDKAPASTIDGYRTACNSLLAFFQYQELQTYHVFRSGRKRGHVSTPILPEYLPALRFLASYANRFTVDLINVNFLKSYQFWMESRGNAAATVGIYLRNIRHIFKRAMKKPGGKSMEYPFSRDGYTIPIGNNNKRALEVEDIRLIYNYNPQCVQEQQARDFWLLTFLSNGINMKDIALLREANYEDDLIVIKYRAKIVRNVKKNIPPIIILLSDQIQQIIARWGTKKRTANSYIFPILAGLGPQAEDREIRKRVQNFTRLVNNWMKRIAVKLGLPPRLTTIVARHSFASNAVWSGESTEFVMESLGQTSLATAQNYIKGLPDKRKKDYAQKIAASLAAPLEQAS
ncbi:tyrosine-type recombinase/integrase [Chitinophaga sp. 30R24]|uniref:tyrosine-type recombinase/integrase n=1 Tax=Chitinophaga sp. 30R24 TaxID=3248838 RepID=UPI003B906EEF